MAPIGQFFGASAAVRAFHHVKSRQKVRRRDQTGRIELPDRSHGVTAASAARTRALAFARLYVHHPIDHAEGFRLAFDFEGFLLGDLAHQTFRNAAFCPLPHHETVAQGLSAAFPQRLHRHAALTLPDAEQIELIENDFELVAR